MSILDAINSKEITTYVGELPNSREPLLGEVLFPAQKQLSLDVQMIKGVNNLPVALRASTYDAVSTLRERPSFQTSSTELPYFKEAMKITEHDMNMLAMFENSKNYEAVKPIFRNIFDDAGRLIYAARITAEDMRMQLLSTGKIFINDNRVLHEIDYHHPDDNKEELVGDVQWGEEKATPLSDLARWADDVEDRTGERPARAIMTRATFNLLANATELKAARFPGLTKTQLEGLILSAGDIKDIVYAHTGITIATYDKRFIKHTEQGKGTHKLFPDNVVSLIPEGVIGRTVYGPTPEERSLQFAQGKKNDVYLYNEGVAITTILENDPVNVSVIASAAMLPTTSVLDSVFIAKVKEDENVEG